MKFAVLFCAILLTGCTHSILLVKAVHVTANGNNTIRCVVTASNEVKPDIKAKADQLCAEIQTGGVHP